MKTSFKTILLVGLLGFAPLVSRAAIDFTFVSGNTYNATWSGTQALPDNNLSGVAYGLDFNVGGINYIGDVSVEVSISGGYNGDLYAYLSHGDSIVVLLNRIGRTAGNADGTATSGLSTFTLSSLAATDVHGASGTAGQPLTGTYAPDGRYISPTASGATFDAAARNATFSTLVNDDPNGTWTLFFADASPGFSGSLMSWNVNVDAFATPVPEPITWAMGGFGALFGGLQWRRYLRSRAS